MDWCSSCLRIEGARIRVSNIANKSNSSCQNIAGLKSCISNLNFVFNCNSSFVVYSYYWILPDRGCINRVLKWWTSVPGAKKWVFLMMLFFLACMNLEFVKASGWASWWTVASGVAFSKTCFVRFWLALGYFDWCQCMEFYVYPALTGTMDMVQWIDSLLRGWMVPRC